MTGRFLLIFLAALIVSGCESKTEQPTATGPLKATDSLAETRAFSEPTDAYLVETATEALPIWRAKKQKSRTLILLSNNPFLQSIPAKLQDKAVELTLNGSQEEIEQKAVYRSSDPILMPSMALSAALQSKLFDTVIWVLPLGKDAEMTTPDVIRSQLLATGDISKSEAGTLTQEGNLISGKLRGANWSICRIDSLPSTSKPVVLHIDLSYFSARYKNEISTPLYSFLAETALSLRDKKLRVSTATVSTSNLSGNISLKTRFFGQDIVTLLEHPGTLDATEMPQLWQQRSKALYLDNLFQQEKVREIYLELNRRYPASAPIKFALFDILGQMKEANSALKYLQEAVALDRIYALEYLNLSERAYKKGQFRASMALLDKAAEAFPNDPFISLKKIGLYRETGGIKHAAELIADLKNRNWSPVYDPDMPKLLDTLAQEAVADKQEP